MFVRVTHMDIAAGHWDEAMQRFQTQAVAELEKRPGFMRTILTGDAKTGKAMAITMWQAADGDHGPPHEDPIVGCMSGLLDGVPETAGYPELFEREF